MTIITQQKAELLKSAIEIFIQIEELAKRIEKEGFEFKKSRMNVNK